MSKQKEPYCDLDCFHCQDNDCYCPDAECVTGLYDNGGASADWERPAEKQSRRKPRISAEEYFAKKRKMIREIIEKEKALYEALQNKEGKE